MLEIYDLTTEHLYDPVGLDSAAPRFGWKLKSDKNNVMQTAYQISVSSHGREIWNSGRVVGEDSQNVRYWGPALSSAQPVCWKVVVWTKDEQAVSKDAYFEMGLLHASDWQGRWIEPEEEIDYDVYKPSPLLRKEFAVREGLVRARIYQSAHGLYEFWINGTRGTEDRFNPGLTSYYYRTQYQTYDILPLLHKGRNCWAVQLGDGWWRGTTGGGYRNNFGFRLHFIGQIVLEYADGSRDVICTDENFKTSFGGLLYSDMKAGDFYDARLEPEGWTAANFDDSGWIPVHYAEEFTDIDALCGRSSVPVREREHFDAKPFRDADGNLILDFGQNIAGYVYMKLRSTRSGQKVTLKHGEALKNGRFSVENISSGTNTTFQQVDYVCSGKALETYRPSFSVFGFRYVKVEGYGGEIQPGDFVAVAVYSDLRDTGSFSCSNPLLNRLVQNSHWSQKGNFLDGPTDCPTRERSTWSGDGQVYAMTATRFMDVYPFYEKWLKDLTLEQFENGCIGTTFPATNALHNYAERERMLQQGRCVFGPPPMCDPKGEPDLTDGAAGWGDVATIAPMAMYLAYGDKSILAQQYACAKKWSLYQRNAAREHNPLYESQPEYHTYNNGIPDGEYIFDTKFHWGEWMEPDAVENGGPRSFNPPEMAKRGNPIVATAYLYYSSVLMAQMAEIMGYTEDAEDFSSYAGEVKRVYNKYFIQNDGTILEGRQAAYTRVLAFGLADEEKEPMVAKKLYEAVVDNDYKLNTGFLSTPFLLKQLCDFGYQECAFRVLEQTESPGWLHPITLGATTILESWEGMDGYFNSFNHYSYGAVCDFLFSTVAGIQPLPETPGYKHFQIKPVIGGSLTHAEATQDSPYGKISVAWRKTEDSVTYFVTIPANTRATVMLDRKLCNLDQILGQYSQTRLYDAYVSIEMGSGTYTL